MECCNISSIPEATKECGNIKNVAKELLIYKNNFKEIYGCELSFLTDLIENDYLVTITLSPIDVNPPEILMDEYNYDCTIECRYKTFNFKIKANGI